MSLGKSEGKSCEPLISVIVPVYNVEKYLKQCIDSIVEQTYSRLQILLIDDGSTDGSGEICKQYEARDARVQYIRIPNGGVSHARNVGLDYAEGEYVTFVDADDYLDRNILKLILGGDWSEELKILRFNVYFEYPDSIVPNRKFCCKNATLEEIYASVISEYETEEFYLSFTVHSVWGAIFRRDFIESVHARFSEELYIGEDVMFFLKLLNGIKAEEFGVVNEYGYYYRRHANSAVNRYKSDLYIQFSRQAEEFKVLLIEKYGRELPQLLQDAYAAFFWITFLLLSDNFCTRVREGWQNIWQKDEDSCKWLEQNKTIMLEGIRNTRYPLNWRRYKMHQLLSRVLRKHDSVRTHLRLEKWLCAAKYYFWRIIRKI